MSDSTFETPFLKTLHNKQNVYDRFVPDQVLTHHNLNKIIDYFEDESRQSRVYSVGVGIGCGLDFTIEKNENEKTIIKIHSGVGITTDGDLVVVNHSKSENTLVFATAFENKANYAKFEGLKLYELHSIENSEDLIDKQALDGFENLSDFYVLAYVENFSENPGLCSGTGCDDTGEPVYVNLKFLLVDKAGFDSLSSAENDSVFHSNNIFQLYDNLPEFLALKPWISNQNTKGSDSIYQIYKTALETNNLPKKLTENYLKILKYFQNRLANASLSISMLKIKRSIDDIFDISRFPVEDIQYRYDLLNDLIETYTEIKAQILDLKTLCLPDLTAFPKHLLLGAIEESNREASRHQFYPSKLSNTQDEHLEKVTSLLLRFYHQLTQYHLHKNHKKEHEIYITPSKDYSFNLGERSIPYYYETDANLVTNWNYDDLKNRRSTVQLSYHKDNLFKEDFIQNPLNYRHVGHNFYRIEGHLGKPLKNVLSKLKKDKEDYNLAFDVKAISLNNAIEDLNIKDYSCQFEDLTTLLQAWRDEFDCLLRSGFEFFKLYDFKEPGKNDTKTKYVDFIKNAGKIRENIGFINFKEIYNLQGIKVDNVGDPIELNIIENIDNPTIIRSFENRKMPMFKTSNESQEQGFLIINATDYALETSNSYDSEVLYKVAKEHILEKVGQYEDQTEENVYVDIPVRIIADMIAVEATFVDDLQVYTRENALNQFKKNLSKLCFDLSKAKEDIVEARGKEVFGRKKKDSMYEFMVYELSKLCCFQSKINWLLKEIEKRKAEMFKKLRLSEIVKHHPGLEHLAGVPKGGTFVVVYAGKNPKTDIFSDEVIADFCYPYMCVSECTPDMVIINQQAPIDENLSLDKDVYCSSDGIEISNGMFSVEPQDGIITSDQGDSFIENNKQFNPNKVKDELLGLPISFKVNGKPSNQTALVFKIPSEEYFNNPDHLNIEVTKNEDNESADVVVTPKTPYDNKAYLTYLWKDDSGKEVSTAPILRVTLLIENGAVTAKYGLSIGVNHPEAECVTNIPVLIQEKLEENTEVDLNFSPEVFCFKADARSKKVPLEVVPENGIVTSDQQGEDFIKDNQFVPKQVPDQLLGKPIKFKVNNKLVAKTATVYKLPEDQHFQNKNVEVNVKAINTSDGVATLEITPKTPYDSNAYLAYTWLNVNNETLSTTKTLSIDLPINDSRVNEQFKLQLGVKNKLADCLETYDIKIDEPIEIEEENSCYQAYKSRVSKYNFNTVFENIASKTKRTSFGSALKQGVLNPTIQAVNDAKKLKEDNFKNNVVVVTTLVDLLETLSNNYIQDVQKSDFLSIFMVLHEILVIMILELTRCKTNTEIAEIASLLIRYEQIIKSDNMMFVEFGVNYKALSNKYFKTYKPKSQRLLKIKTILNIN